MNAITDMNTKPAGLLYRPLVQMLVIALVAFVAYSNSFRVPFVFDDKPSITENVVIQGLENFFTNWSGYDFLPNRFIGYLTFAFNHEIGGLNVSGYHVVNLAIHIVNALLVYALVRLTMKTPFFGSRPQVPSPESLVPVLAALLFVSHPIQTQAVTYIVQRLTSLATLFYLASLVLHVRWRLAQTAGVPFVSRSVLPWYLLSLVSAVLAMKTKEIAFTLPVVILLYEFSFFGRPGRRLLPMLLPLLLTIFIIPLTMVNVQKPVGEILSDVHSKSIAGTDLSRGEYLSTQFSVIVTYLRLLVLPINQNLDYDYPVSHSLLEPRAFLSLLLLLVLMGYAAWLWRTSSSSQSPVPSPGLYRLAAFGIIWFFITLSVESSIIPIQDVIFEHRLYLPSIGFVAAFVVLVMTAGELCAARLPAIKKLTIPVLAMSVLMLTGATYARNNVWKDELTLWEDTKSKSPMKARPHNNLGYAYGKQKRIPEAIAEFETAVQLAPEYLDALYNLAQLYFLSGRYQETEELTRTLKRLNPETFKTLDALRDNKKVPD